MVELSARNLFVAIFLLLVGGAEAAELGTSKQANAYVLNDDIRVENDGRYKFERNESSYRTTQSKGRTRITSKDKTYGLEILTDGKKVTQLTEMELGEASDLDIFNGTVTQFSSPGVPKALSDCILTDTGEKDEKDANKKIFNINCHTVNQKLCESFNKPDADAELAKTGIALTVCLEVVKDVLQRYLPLKSELDESLKSSEQKRAIESMGNFYREALAKNKVKIEVFDEPISSAAEDDITILLGQIVNLRNRCSQAKMLKVIAPEKPPAAPREGKKPGTTT